MGLQTTIDWLLSVEHLAGAFYNEVAEGFKEDKRISKFFRHCAAEEAWHAEVMSGASEYLIEHIAPPFSISMDDETKEKIETPFVRNRELLSTGNFSKENVIDCLARTEFSEWNDIFIYVVKSLKEEREFMPIVAKMHEHLREIEQFMKTLPEGRKHLYIIKSLPRVWKEHILIIDDDPFIVEFLKKVLEYEGHVETAQNGREGLQMVKEKYFDVIISDISMPVMDGIEFYNQASADDPQIRKRVMYFSSFSKREHTDFIRNNNLNYLPKPAPIREILKKVSELLHKTNMGD